MDIQCAQGGSVIMQRTEVTEIIFFQRGLRLFLQPTRCPRYSRSLKFWAIFVVYNDKT